MKDGFIKVAAGTPRIRVADCVYNAQSAAALARRAAGAGAKLLVLPELCLTGYTCGDLFFQQTLLEGAEDALLALARETAALELLLFAGAPLRCGGKILNCAVALLRGKILCAVPKTFLPNYGEFYEQRQFSPAPEENGEIVLGGAPVPIGTKLLLRCREIPSWAVGVEICEDLWSAVPPSTALAAGGATVIANLSASDETVGKPDYRRALVTGQAARLLCGYLYADAGAGESTTDMVFSGHNLIAENGALLAESAPFSGELALSEIDVERLCAERRRMTTFPAQRETLLEIPFSMPPTECTLTRRISPTPFIPDGEEARERCCREVLAIQSGGLCGRLKHTGAKSAVVGVSGGLDSALALLVTVRAMDLLSRPRSEVTAVTMPCFGTTSRTLENARALCRALGVTLLQVDITDSVRAHFADIGHREEARDVTYENAQARERTQVLMDIANSQGGLVVGTGDLSELALGWATYNGDHMSMYGVNSAVPKTLVRHLTAHEAAVSEGPLRDTLSDILDTPVSPELLPAQGEEIVQKTEELTGPYELHDFFLYYVIRWHFPPRKVLRLARAAFGGAYDGGTILHWLKSFYRRFFAQQFKRSCLPDGPKVGSVSLSPRGDWRMPSDAVSRLWLAQLENLG